MHQAIQTPVHASLSMAYNWEISKAIPILELKKMLGLVERKGMQLHISLDHIKKRVFYQKIKTTYKFTSVTPITR